MTDEKRAWYEERCKKLLASKYRQDQEYGSYLDRWLHDDMSVDGAPLDIRLKHREPMPFNVYMYG